MSEPPLRIVVPGVPRPWERAGHRVIALRGGKPYVATYTPTQTRSEQGAWKLFAQRAMEGRPPIEGPIDLRFVAYMPVPRSWSGRKQADALAGIVLPTARPDADNLVKMIDALTGIVWRDDSQITDLALWKRFSAEPRIVIEVRPIITDAARINGAGKAAG